MLAMTKEKIEKLCKAVALSPCVDEEIVDILDELRRESREAA